MRMNRADTRTLRRAMIYAAEGIVAAEPELTRIDTVIGDGDHGMGMKLGFTALKNELESGEYDTPYALFHACGLCLVKSMGGSSGVLFGSLFIGGLEGIRGLKDMDGGDICAFLSGGIDAIVRRGKAKPGDKTMVDALLPAREMMRRTLAGTRDIDAVLKAAYDGALAGAERTREMLPRIGRSKNFREKALGWPDPGAVSVSLLLGGLYRGLL